MVMRTIVKEVEDLKRFLHRITDSQRNYTPPTAQYTDRHSRKKDHQFLIMEKKKFTTKYISSQTEVKVQKYIFIKTQETQLTE